MCSSIRVIVLEVCHRQCEALLDQRCLASVECLLFSNLLGSAYVPPPTGVGVAALEDFLWLSLNEDEGCRIVARYIVMWKSAEPSALQYAEVVLKKDALASAVARHEVCREEQFYLIIDFSAFIPR